MTPAPSPVRWPLLIYAVMIQTLGYRAFTDLSPIDLARVSVDLCGVFGDSLLEMWVYLNFMWQLGGCVELYCTSPAWALGGFGALGDDNFLLT